MGNAPQDEGYHGNERSTLVVKHWCAFNEKIGAVVSI